jgi:hypothetical protein
MHYSGLKDSIVALLERSGWCIEHHAASLFTDDGVTARYYYNDSSIMVFSMRSGWSSFDFNTDEELIKLLYLKRLL